MVRFLIGVALALGALLGGFLLEGGVLWQLAGLSAFTITFFVPLFAVLAVWDFKTLAQAWSAAFRPVGKDEARRLAEVWKFSELACYLAGVLGSLIGGILILSGVDWSQPARVGHAFAAALIAPLYGTLFGLIERILRARVEHLSSS